MADTDTLESLLRMHRLAFRENPYPPMAQRRRWLRRLAHTLRHHADELVTALDRDYGGRSGGDSIYGDIMSSLGSIQYARFRLRSWMRPVRRWCWPPLQPGRCRVQCEPLGVVGIIVPWNYPVYLCLSPLAAALAAGNRVMLKLSEFSPETNRVLRRICAQALGEQVTIHEGEAEAARDFSRLAFDHLLFTGSVAKGREVGRAAAENLTPVTLELGGKSPVLITPGYPVARAVQRTVFGKCINAGQTCVAPDYILCPSVAVEALASAFRREFIRMYPDFPDNPDYTMIRGDAHRRRLKELLDDAVQHGARILPLGEAELTTGNALPRRTPLTLVLDATPQMRIMREEVFGPLLPVVSFDSIDEAYRLIAALPEPLTVYAFTHDRQEQREVARHTRSGGLCFNEVATQVLQEDLPFGGLGRSGMGRYHGREGFATFSNQRALFDRGRLSPVSFASPPYRKWMHRLMFRLFAGR